MQLHDAFPEWLLELATKRRSGAKPERAAAVTEKIPSGQRNHVLASIAGTMRRRGLGEAEILAALTVTNETRCQPPLPADELAQIVQSVSRYDPAERLGEPVYVVPARTLNDVVAVFRKYLHLPDATPLLVTLAATVANQMTEGDPVWVVIIGGSSRGKTEILMALDGLVGVRITGALTTAAMLSGTSRKDRGKNATGGILRELGDAGIIVVKDLGAILALHRDARGQVLQALRDVYDGRYTRDVGVDGGVKLEWSGRVGLLGAATSALDRAHAVLSALGERWITVRLPDGGEEEMVRFSLGSSDTTTVRRELRDVVHGFLATMQDVPLRRVSPTEEAVLVALAPLVCLARSPVDRDPVKRDIVFVHEPEGPARIARQLHKLLVALEAIGADPVRTIVRIGIDSIPSPRREALLYLLERGEERTSRIAVALDLPRPTTERALEELTAHGVVSRRKSTDEDSSPNLWRPTETVARRWTILAPYWQETA